MTDIPTIFPEVKPDYKGANDSFKSLEEAIFDRLADEIGDKLGDIYDDSDTYAILAGWVEASLTAHYGSRDFYGTIEPMAAVDAFSGCWGLSEPQAS